MINETLRLEIARGLLGEITDRGFCRCPGEDYHTTRKGNKFARIGRDCRVYLVESDKNPRGVPSIVCQHTSCGSIVEEWNKKLRSEIGKAEKHSDYRPAPESREQRERREREREKERALIQTAREEQEKLETHLSQYATALVDLRQEGGFPTSGKGQARALLSIFRPTDIVWTGLHAHSISTEDALQPENADRLAKIRAARPFRTAKEWIDGELLPGPRISPSAFKPGILSRSNQFIAARRFIVIEHDKFPLDKQAALMRWLMEAEGLRLRALIFTGGKSLHGWFDYPACDIETLRARLCGVYAGEKDEKGRAIPTGGLLFDPATFNPSHSYRVPGWKHDKTRKPVELWRLHL